MKLILALLSGLWAVVAVADPTPVEGTLSTIQNRGHLLCGVSDGLPGFSAINEEGSYAGFDVDICRAIAAAVFGDAGKVKYIPLTTKERLEALRSGAVDVLSHNTTWTATRDAAGLNFAGIAYYDGQGFLVNKNLGVKSARELDGAAICMQPGTTSELNVSDYFSANGIKYTPVSFEKADESAAALGAGRCDALTSDQSQLLIQRLKLDNPENYVVLPEIISKEPLGPVVRHGDDQWFDIVKWTLFALLNAEELGVTSKNVEQLLKSPNPDIKRLLGVEGELGKSLGLKNDWSYNAIKQIGNYGEMFARHLGKDSPLQIERGLNALWTQGGLHYAPPFR